MFKCQVQSTYLIYRLLIETFIYFYLRLELDDLNEELVRLEPNTDLDEEAIRLEPNTDLDEGLDGLENIDLDGVDGVTRLKLLPVDTPLLLKPEPL